MYNHYQRSGHFSPVEPDSFPSFAEHKSQPQKKAVSAESEGGFIKLLDQLKDLFKMKSLDTGDILLLLIILFLFLEGDNLELVITLGLMLLFSLNED